MSNLNMFLVLPLMIITIIITNDFLKGINKKTFSSSATDIFIFMYLILQITLYVYLLIKQNG
jgi:ATP/ADP translocase